jgi:hypothetical protein
MKHMMTSSNVDKIFSKNAIINAEFKYDFRNINPGTIKYNKVADRHGLMNDIRNNKQYCWCFDKVFLGDNVLALDVLCEHKDFSMNDALRNCVDINSYTRTINFRVDFITKLLEIQARSNDIAHVDLYNRFIKEKDICLKNANANKSNDFANVDLDDIQPLDGDYLDDYIFDDVD